MGGQTVLGGTRCPSAAEVTQGAWPSLLLAPHASPGGSGSLGAGGPGTGQSLQAASSLETSLFSSEIWSLAGVARPHL